ncbi:ImmA/IrrE family metallo-endopeptidase [Secundilactobacillus kimchicus]|uniref:IrrE N-terminal-like domain-containing protein n=1 Tax=Secundilactobacillus kimchicus JCM 15530 TaxID=1302272 RepID=A0A0R1HW62_9LACO|nr:ImmA/IrrE family metallo-endopeptidase [Secundilactobacillus kimchicus]KRK47578.1 hypothetical protein FC96_GL002300 [Secundilactobacillus kimchicus JCM 15530]MBT9672238.1 ImmA/IrrE family metallo-endopeptidase [Secundilactobacillus kimchicus]
MNDYLEAMLNFAFDHNISCQLTNVLSIHTPSGAYPQERRLVINTSWYKPNQLPFIAAHEISHILHEDDGILYFHTDSTRSIEGSADRAAVALLVDEYHKRNDEIPNYVNFMRDFEIPASLEDVVKKELRNQYM